MDIQARVGMGRRTLLTSLFAAAPLGLAQQTSISTSEEAMWALLWEIKRFALVERTLQRSALQTRIAEMQQDVNDTPDEIRLQLQADLATTQASVTLFDHEIGRLETDCTRIEQWLAANRR